MAEDSTKTYVFGQDANSVLPYLNNGFGGFGNLGGGIIGFLLGTLFSGAWGGNGLFGNGGFGGGAAAGYLGNQINNDNNTDLIMNAINGTDADVRQLATTINADFNDVKAAVNTIQSGLQVVGSQVGMSGLQVINSIQSGNAALSRQLCECCCENRLLTTQQGYEAQLRTIEQTNQLGSQADRNTRDIVDAIAAQTTAMTKEFCDVKERELQNKIDTLTAANTTLRGQIDNANQTAAINSYVASLIVPIQKEVSEIKASQPNTVPVQWPNLTAVNTTPYMGGFSPYGYGLSGSSYWG